MSRSKRKGRGPRCSPWRLSEREDKDEAARWVRRVGRLALRLGADPPERMIEGKDRWGFKKSG